MAGPLRGSYHGAPYEINADRRSGTVTVTNPEDGKAHAVAVARDGGGHLNITSIDGYSMGLISTMASAEQMAGIRKMAAMIHGAEGQITREINKADGIVDPVEVARLKAEHDKKLQAEADAKHRREEAARLADEAKRKVTPPEPTEVARDRGVDLPPPAVVEQRHDPVIADKIPLPRSDPRKARITPVADTRPIDHRAEPEKGDNRRPAGKGEKYRIAEGIVHYGQGESAGSLRLRHMKDGRTMVFRDPHTKLSELLHGPKRDAAFRALREKLGEVHDAPHRRELKFMTSVLTHLGKKENTADRPPLRRREHVVEAAARPIRELTPRDGTRAPLRTALFDPFHVDQAGPQDMTRQAQIQRGGPKGPGFFG